MTPRSEPHALAPLVPAACSPASSSRQDRVFLRSCSRLVSLPRTRAASDRTPGPGTGSQGQTPRGEAAPACGTPSSGGTAKGTAERPPTLRQREGAWIGRRGGQTPPLLLLIELPPSWPGQRLPPRAEGPAAGTWPRPSSRSQRVLAEAAAWLRALENVLAGDGADAPGPPLLDTHTRVLGEQRARTGGAAGARGPAPRPRRVPRRLV